jgi:hypothetical protein
MPREAQAQGTGETKPLAQGAGAQAGGGAEAGGPGGGPGGGLGRPIDTPDPLHEYRWQFLGGLALLLAMGAFFVWNRGATAVAPGAGFAAPSGAAMPTYPPATRDRSAVLLEALKEELFQLETERYQGKISTAEYEKAKAALDQTIQRAVTRTQRKG